MSAFSCYAVSWRNIATLAPTPQDVVRSPFTSYTPSQPTNAYITSVTLPIGSPNWTLSAGYYYGSGRQAVFTDQNGAKTYSHFMDPFDRGTEDDYPIGWDKTVYTSPTQIDAYDAVADTTASANCQSCQDNRTLLDSFGRKISQLLENYPGGASEVDTAYDVNGRVYSVTHPYQSSGQVYEYFSYDGLSRLTQNTHPDNENMKTFYGPNVTLSGAGGVSSQQGSTATYGYGYPVVTVDEDGKQRQKWLDAFGRIIEVDEPGTTAATPGQGSVSVSGSEQSIGGSPATPGKGTVTISGSERTAQKCVSHGAGGDCLRYQTVYDYGTVSITVNGHLESVTYQSGSSSSTIASALASAFNGDSGSPVTATVSGSVVTLTSKTTGSSTNYSLSATSSTGDPTDFGYASFSTTPSGSTLTGGNNAVGATYDSGTVSITVDGSQFSVSYGQNSTPSSLASALAQAINGTLVTASASGTVVSLTSVATGSTTNYSLSASSSTSDPAQFSSPSFSGTPSGSTLTGGAGSGSSLGSPTATFYTYDAADHLTQVAQGLQTRTFVYDGLGRATSITTPEAGTENFSYTNSGSLCAGAAKAVCQKTDARGITTTYTYDSLSRLTGKAYSNTTLMPNVCTTAPPNSTSAHVCNYYDAGGATAYANGRLTSVTDPSGSEAFSYDPDGRVTQEVKAIGSTSYPIQYGYNPGGQLTQITYPSGRIVQQNLDKVGLLNTVVSGTTTFASIPDPPTGYNAAQQLLSFTYGNGVAASFAYSSTRQQMTGLSYVMGSTTLFSLNYYYQNDPTNCTSGTPGNDGLIQCIVDNTPTQNKGYAGRTVAYTYDALGRISTALTAGTPQFAQWGMLWTYDQYGNRLNQTVTAGSAPSNFLTFATTPPPPANPPGGAYTNRPDGYSFDASGNMLSDGENTLSYDAENCLISSANGDAGTSTYTCDSHGVRVLKALQGSTTTAYVFSGGKDIAEYDNGAAVNSPSREYIYLGGRLISTVQGTTTLYHHSDHLSVRVTTDVNGTNVGEQGHYPYGDEWYATNTTTKFIFTSYEHDFDSGNDYAMARFYVNRFGRFACVDPLLGQPGDPQRWNRYAYVRNNPTNNVDPTGTSFIHWLFSVFRLLANIFLGGTSSGSAVGLGTPPIFSDPIGNTQATLNSIYNPVNASKFSTGPFLQPGSDYYDPATETGYSSASETDPLKLFLQATSDCGRGGDREIAYNLMQEVNGKTKNALNYTVQEHITILSGTLFSSGASQKPENSGYSGYNDYITGVGSRDTLQTFTAWQQGGSPVDVFVRDVSGHDWGTNGIWVQGARGSRPAQIFVNGVPTPQGVDCNYPQ